MNRNPLVLVVCGAGTLTSVIASQGVEQGLKKRGITDVEIKVGRLDDIGRYADRITVLVASMNIRQKYDFPVINAISFLTGDEDGQERVVDKVADILKNMEFMARSEADCSNAWISPLPAPSRTISIKIPHATANPVRKVLSLLRLMVLYISCQMSIMIMFV